MALTYIPTSELEAVNSMLETIGEMPVNSLTDSGNTDSAIAYRALHRINREVQAKGLHCNTEEKYPLSKDEDDKFPIPSNALRVDFTYNDKDLVQRGGFLYDRENHTDIFTETTIDVDITFFLPFTDLPEIVRQFIYIKAAREFQQKVLGSPDIDKGMLEDEQRAWIEVYRQECLNRDDSILDNPTVFAISNRRF
jgi:hypothetical protein